MGDDGKPYVTLSYANGPGYYSTFDANGNRIDLTNVDTSTFNYTSYTSIFNMDL